MTDDKRGSSLDVRIWGPQAWDFMHAVTFTYPESDPSPTEKKNIVNFFKTTGKVMPCMQCRYHFGEMLKTNPPDLENRSTLCKWLVDRHNDVNVRLHKPTMPYEFVKKKYEKMKDTCPVTNGKDTCACPEKIETQSAHTSKLNYAIMWSLVAFAILLCIAMATFAISKIDFKFCCSRDGWT